MNLKALKNKPPSVVVCITTYNRVDCARINMELIKLNYKNPWPILHACSDPNYTKYIEDVLVKCEPKALQKGAFELLKQAIVVANEKYKPNFIVHLEADTWLMNQGFIEKYIAALESHQESLMAASSWSFDKTYKWKASTKPSKKLAYQITRFTKKIGLKWHIGWKNTISTQFFILKNTNEFRTLINEIPEPDPEGYLEKYLFKKIKNRFGRKSILWIKEREPVHPHNRDTCEKMELYSQHFPSSKEPRLKHNNLLLDGKKETLQRYANLTRGQFMQKLLESKNLDYYNEGAKRY